MLGKFFPAILGVCGIENKTTYSLYDFLHQFTQVYVVLKLRLHTANMGNIQR